MVMVCKRPQFLSFVDAAWLHMEVPTNLMMITGLIVFDEAIDYERLKATLEHRFVGQYPRFRQRVVEPRSRFGLPRWEDDPSFDLSAHLHRIALPAPGDQDALQHLVSDLMSTPLDLGKPLWQFHLIENYGSGCALLGRLHHCVADGIALIQVVLSLTDSDPKAPWPVPEPPAGMRRGWNPLRPFIRPTQVAVDATRRLGGATLRTSARVMHNPEQIVDWARLGSEVALATGRLLLMAPDPKTVLKGKLGVPKRAAWSQPVPLAEVKAIGRAVGGTINDVLMAATAGALRRYLQSREQPVDGLDFRAVVPVNLRPADGSVELGNKFGLVFLSLPVGIADPVERLLELKQRMDALKDSQEPLVAYGILNAIGASPMWVEDVVVNIFGSKATAVMTNVPGPREQLYLAGSPISHMMFWVPQSGRLGLGISILSYNGQVMLGVATDAGLIPDPDTIIAGFHAELKVLRQRVSEVVHQVARQLELFGGEAVDAATGQGSEAVAGAPPVRPSQDLTRIKGIGPHYASLLQAAGIASYDGLAASSVAELEAICQSDLADYQSWIDQAQVLSQER